MKKRKNQISTPPFSYFYMFSKKLYKKNNKVIENITQEIKNKKLYTRGYINGKKINRTKKLKKLIPNFIYNT
jgi:hypothetical protein